MFALVAVILFILAAVGLTTSLNLIAWGLTALSLHLLLGWWPLHGGPAPWTAR